MHILNKILHKAACFQALAVLGSSTWAWIWVFYLFTSSILSRNPTLEFYRIPIWINKSIISETTISDFERGKLQALQYDCTIWHLSICISAWLLAKAYQVHVSLQYCYLHHERRAKHKHRNGIRSHKIPQHQQVSANFLKLVLNLNASSERLKTALSYAKYSSFRYLLQLQLKPLLWLNQIPLAVNSYSAQNSSNVNVHDDNPCIVFANRACVIKCNFPFFADPPRRTWHKTNPFSVLVICQFLLRHIWSITI